MNKKALYSILSTIVAMIVLSVSLVFAIGLRVSAAQIQDEDEHRIIVVSDEEDFKIDSNGVCRGLSNSFFTNVLRWQDNRSGSFYDNGNGIEFDEIYIYFPDTVKVIDYACIYYSNISRYVTFIEIPNSVEEIGTYAFGGCRLKSTIIPSSVTRMSNLIFTSFNGDRTKFKIYCETSEKPENWASGWNDDDYDGVDDFPVIWNCYKTISFNVNGGSDIANQKVCVDDLVVEPTVPTKDGYEFKGWYTDAECTDAYDFETAVTDDVTLYAKWEEVQVQPEQPEPETPAEENSTEVNNQNNSALIWGIAGTAAGILIIGGIVISKRRRK